MTRDEIVNLLVKTLKEVLGLRASTEVEEATEFSHYGMNSINAAKFSYVISQRFSLEITPRVIIEHFCIAELTRYLVDAVGTEVLVNSGDGQSTYESSNDSNEIARDEPREENIGKEARGKVGTTGDKSKQALTEKIIHALLARAARREAVEGGPRQTIVDAASERANTIRMDQDIESGGMDFSFIFFPSNQKQSFARKYEYVTKVAEYADANGFKAIWVPERHFFEFGGIFPDPALLLANIASSTSSIRLRAGSVILPLHHPASVVESWSMLDNLSNGRVDIAFASGWNPNDFVLSSETFGTLRETWLERMSQVERLWQGEAVEFHNGKRELVPIKTFPRAMQSRIAIWMAITGNPESFVEAGKRGYNILTMLTSKPVEELAANIARYRHARAEKGLDPQTGIVSLMLHTYVHDSRERVDACVNEYYFDYIKSGLKGHIQAMDPRPSEAEINRIVEHSFLYQRKHSALFGNVEQCQKTVERMRSAGVNEIACLVDFGLSEAEMYATLPFITQLKNVVNNRDGVHSLPFVEVQPAAHTAMLPSATRVQEFAIVGMAGRYPQSRTIEEFWENLLTNRNCVSEIGNDRYDWQAIWGDPKSESGKANIKHFGLLEDIYRFDSDFFRISKREAELMDPHARLLLEAAWQCIENAGYAPKALHESRTGVFLSFYNSEYSHLLETLVIEKPSEPYLGTALSGAVKANRISYLLGLQGPSETYDTACSSSLVALHRAMQSIEAGDCDQALVAGVSLLLTPQRVISLAKMGILNEGGNCNPFSFPANKENIGEGVGSLFIKPLNQALAAGDYIYAIVSGSDVNHQGNSSGSLTMPSAKSLATLIEATYRKTGLSRENVCYIEGHGSGNDSDVVELLALQQCFASLPPDRKVWVGSVKSNIGFGEASGGMAQLTKCALALNYGIVPATINFEGLDPSIDAATSKLAIQTRNREIDCVGDQNQYISILAYGLGGTNAHVVLRNRSTPSVDAQQLVSPSAPHPMLFSACNQQVLLAYLQDIYTHLNREGVKRNYDRICGAQQKLLNSLSQTLISRERHEKCRVLLMVCSYSELVTQLANLLIGKGQVGDDKTWSLTTSPNNLARPCREHALLEGLTSSWLTGATVDWSAVGQRPFQRLAIPPVPFLGQELRLQPKPRLENTQDVVHPLLHRNTSNLYDTQFTSEFSGIEPFLADHKVNGTRILPGVAYLEMARAAIEKTLIAENQDPAIELTNVAWLRPAVLIGESLSIRISIMAKNETEVEYDIYGITADNQEEQLFCQGQGHLLANGTSPTLDLNYLQSICNEHYSTHEGVYRAYALQGHQYGATHQAIVDIRRGVDAQTRQHVLAKLQLPDYASFDSTAFCLNPGLLDSALQASIGLNADPNVSSSDKTFLPFALESIVIYRRLPIAAYAWVRYTVGNGPSDVVRKLDISVCDERGNLCVDLKGFSSRPLHSDLGKPEQGEVTLEAYDWEAITRRTRDESQRQLGGHQVLFIGSLDHDTELLLRTLLPDSIKCECIDASTGALDLQYEHVATKVQAHIREAANAMPRTERLLQLVIQASEADRNQCFMGLSSLLKTASQEHPKLLTQCILLTDVIELNELARIIRENADDPQSQVIRYQKGRREVRSLQKLPAQYSGNNFASPWREGSVVLITGGLGGLGLILARAIGGSTRNATVILAGRSELTLENERRIDALRLLGLTVNYQRADVIDPASANALLRHIIDAYGTLNAIIHCAGVVNKNCSILKKTVAEWQQVMAPKVTGLINLDIASEGIALEHFVCFSSIASVQGIPGQADYAAANGFMDYYIQYRNYLVKQGRRQGKGVAINWPLWAEGGMRVDPTVEARLRQAGVVPLKTNSGLAAFNRSLQLDCDQIAVFSSKQDAAKIFTPALNVAAAKSARNVKSGPIDEVLLEKAKKVLIRQVSAFLKIDADEIDLDAELSEYGLDSIGLLELGNQLNQLFKIDLIPTVFFEYPTLNVFAAYLTQRFGERLSSVLGVRNTIAGQAEPPMLEKLHGTSSDHSSRRRRESKRPPIQGVSGSTDKVMIAIVGMSGCFPNARNVHEYWDNLLAGVDCITEIPASRWNWQSIYGDPLLEANKTNIKWGAFIDGVDEFDPLFFGISPKEAELMDPHQRLLITHTWNAIEDAGYSAQSLSGSKTAVFVGMTGSGYADLIAAANLPIEGHSSTGTANSIGPNRLSYLFNFHGPSEPIDTACSSSLVAIHRAVQSMHSGECDMAFVGGVQVIITPWAHISFSKAGMLSASGRCKTFSVDANGYARGEGAGMLFLKKLSHAERDCDHIYGVIRGSAENHGGRANSLTAPNPSAQAELIKTAYREAKIDPRSVTYIEAHGTGTPLGDPIEINGLKNAFSDLLQDFQLGSSVQNDEYCGLGSVKSNIGHLELAAGVAGVIKVLLQLKHRVLVKSLHSEVTNPLIQLHGSPFYIVRDTQHWQGTAEMDGQVVPRRAGVSSFGFGGVNAHVIIEEYLEPNETRRHIEISNERLALVVLSAKNELRMKALVQQLLDRLNSHHYVDSDLTDIAYTLQVGREAMEYRLAFAVRTINELREKLTTCTAEEKQRTDFEECFRGEVKKHKEVMSALNADGALHELLAKWLSQGKYERLLELWTKGLLVDWAALYKTGAIYGESAPKRISLPTYPFCRDRYWIESSRHTSQGGLQTALHPLAQQNTSTLDEQCFSSTFSGEEFYLNDHVVKGNKVLPGVCYLEMARTAVKCSVGMSADKQATISLRNVVWMHPIIVAEATAVKIRLSGGGNGEIDFVIYTTGHEGIDQDHEIVHAQGRACLIGVNSCDAIESIDWIALSSQCNRSIDVARVYSLFSEMGISYGPAHRSLISMHIGTDSQGQSFVLAEINLPKCVQETQSTFLLHPSLLDGALQASIGLKLGDGDVDIRASKSGLSLPFVLERMEIFGEIPAAARVIVRQQVHNAQNVANSNSVQKLDIDVFDELGRVLVRLVGFTTRTMEGALAQPSVREIEISTVLFAPAWQPRSLTTGMQPSAEEFGERTVFVDAMYDELIPELQARWPEVNWLVLPECDLNAGVQADKIIALGEAVFGQVQSMLLAKPKRAVLIQLLIGTKASDASREAFHLASALNGLLKSAHQENPKFVGQVVTIGVPMSAADIVRLLVEHGEDSNRSVSEARCVGRGREVTIFAELPTDSAGPQTFSSLPWKDGGVYLITGGSGGLGLIFAKEILQRRNRVRVVLTGRSELSHEKQAQVAALNAEALTGASVVQYRVLDVCDVVAVTQCIREIAERYDGLNGILHAAGVVRDNFIIKKTDAEFRAVLSTKVTGTLNLDRATQNIELDFFILFSSASSVFGNVGQSDYAFGNGFMDGYAAYRNDMVKAGLRFGRTLSMNWPLWMDGGMRVDQVTQTALQRQGFGAITSTDGIAALNRAWSSDASQVLVVAGEVRKIKQLLELTERSSNEAGSSYAAKESESVHKELANAEVIDASDLLEKVQLALVAAISKLLKVRVEDIDRESELAEFGFDSISLTAFGNILNQSYGLVLSPTIFFEYSTVRNFAEYLTSEHTAILATVFSVRSIAPKALPKQLQSPQAAASMIERRITANRLNLRPLKVNAESTRPEPAKNVGPIAIVGMSCNFPGAATLGGYWENLRSGTSSISEVPISRWDWLAIYGDPETAENKTNIKWGGFIEGVDQFDPLFFGISPREAVLMDPQQRLLMTHAWHAIEDAGYAASSLSETATGVFIGTGNTGYHDLVTQSAIAIEGYSSTGTVPSVGPNRLSYLLNIHGPSEPIETACSSSLVAIHRAVRAMRSGECEMALVGGINTIVTPWAHISFSKAGMLCEDGRCKTFSKNANGYVRGEGVGILFLKTLVAAECDRDHIYGLIKGSAENHGGRATSLTAPNPKAQAELIKTAYRDANIDLSTVTYIETHGTGTPLGDPIEINGLKKAFKELSAERGEANFHNAYCGLGSVKTNIGHLEFAAGAAGVIKVLLQMKHKMLVKSLYCEEINPYIQLQDSPFYIVTETQPWVSRTDAQGCDLPRRAGVSSFGFGGVNAHVIIEEYSRIERASDAAQIGEHPALIMLSAKNQERLQAHARQLLSYVSTHPLSNSDLFDVAYTLQIGREAMEYRLAMTAPSVDELKQKLVGYLDGKVSTGEIEECYQGEVKQNKETLSALNIDDDTATLINTWIGKGKFGKLLDLWVKGLSYDWSKLYGASFSYREEMPKRISLPTYPFASDRYWVDVYPSAEAIDEQLGSGDVSPDGGAAASEQQPLGLEANASELRPIRETPTVARRPALRGLSIDDCVLWELKELASELLKLAREKLDVDENLAAFGFDSIGLAGFAKRLSAQYAVDVLPSIFFSHATLRKVGMYLLGEYREALRDRYGDAHGSGVRDDMLQLGQAKSLLKKQSHTKESKRLLKDEVDSIAIVGMSGRFPGARTIAELWQILVEGRDAVQEIPLARFDWRGHYEARGESDASTGVSSGKTNSKWLGVLPGVDEFDPLFFEISPKEAQAMDPRQRLLLQESFKALEDAGYGASQLSRQKIGMFVGVEQGDYQLLLDQSGAEGSLTANHDAILASRLSYCLNLHGPAMAINTACSSGLVALHQACLSLRAQECDTAIAASVNLILTPNGYIGMSQAGMLSPDGRCYAFDQRANGMVPGEAVLAIVVKSLSQAQANNDLIYAVIRGSGINYDGKTNGLTAPNGAAQTALFSEVYARSKLRPDEIEYIVTHGTGTRLGDPVEINALRDAFKDVQCTVPFCALTSTKSNVGHTFAASGLVSVVSLVQAMQHEMIPASLHCEQLSDYIDWTRSPFYVNTQNKAWPKRDGKRRIGAVSAFGMSGTNAHVLVESYEQEVGPLPSEIRPPCYLLALSAKNELALAERVRDLAELLKTDSRNWDAAALAALSYTLLNHRQHFTHRCAVVVADREQAIHILDKASGSEKLPMLFKGRAASEYTEQSLLLEYAHDLLKKLPPLQGDPSRYKQSLVVLAGLYSQGYQLDWTMLYGEVHPQRLSLPTYPFARERYWVEACASQSAIAAVADRGADETPADEWLAEDSVETEQPPRNIALPMERLLFAEAWQLQAVEAARPLVGFYTVAVLLSDPQRQAALQSMLAKIDPQIRALFIVQRSIAAEVSSARYGVFREDKASYAEVFQSVVATHGALDAVWYLWGLEDASCLVDQSPIVHVIQGLASAGIKQAKVLLAAEYGSALERCYVESWIGYERSLRQVLPEMQVAVLHEHQNEAHVSDEAETSADSVTVMERWAQRLWTETQAEQTESVLYCAADRQVLRTHPIKIASAVAPAAALRHGGTYLITGGLGGLGYVFAEHLARCYAANLILVGRSSIDAQKETQLHALARLGGQTLYVMADVGDRDQMQRALDQGLERFGVLHGVLHAAGIESRTNVLSKEWSAIEAVLLPKIGGTIVLGELLAAHALDFVCYFSSTSAALGDFGSCDYAVGNRFELAYAKYVNRNALAICWPLWADGGMGFKDQEATQLYLQSSGQRALPAVAGVEIFEQLLVLHRSGLEHALVLLGERPRVYRMLGLTPPVNEFSQRQGHINPRRRPELQGLSIDDCVLWELKELASELLKLAREKLDVDENLAAFGFDSIGLAGFAKRLSAQYAVDVLPSIFFSHATLRKVGMYLLGEYREALRDRYGDAHGSGVRDDMLQLGQAKSLLKKQSHTKESKRLLKDEVDSIAIVGMSGRFPGARTIAELWQILVEGRDAVQEIPLARFDWRGHYEARGESDASTGVSSGKTNSKWLGVLPGVDEFDPLFFEISPKEAQAMDPRQRLLLQESFKALEDAGYGASQLSRQKIGMFVGVEQGDYQLLLDQSGAEGSLTANHDAILASRLSYCLNLHGPAMAINTACSSGLVALHQACLSLRAQECDTAIAASVNLILTPNGYIGMSQAGMLSPDGRCYAFDQRANGMVPGEAVLAIVVKSLSQAQANNDLIYAVIRGSGINYDGKTNGLTAPNGAAQTALFSEVYARSKLRPDEIEYIVTHGTGTRLGDPVEINALRDAFKDVQCTVPFCALTSTKSNVGHTFAASGLVSVVSLVQAMQHEMIPASLHCEQLSDYIDWTRSPFYVNTQNKAWPKRDGKRRIGAVSAFGMSGTNAHVVIESYDPTDAAVHADIDSQLQPPFYLLTLSAKTETALLRRAQDLISLLTDERHEWKPAMWAALSHTLLNHRQHFNHRCALVIANKEQALALLGKIDNSEKLSTLLRGKVAREFAEQPMLLEYANDLLGKLYLFQNDPTRYQHSLAALGDLYCQGYQLKWTVLFGDHLPQRISLPTYPFAKEQHWVASNVDNEIARTSVVCAENRSAVRKEANHDYTQVSSMLDELLLDECSVSDFVFKLRIELQD